MTRTLPFALLALSALSAVAAPRPKAPEPVITGWLKDVFHDPTDRRYLFIYLETTNGPYYTAAPIPDSNAISRLEAQIGAEVRVRGRPVPSDRSFARPYAAREIQLHTLDAITILNPAPTDIFALPNESTLWHMTPDRIATQGFRTVRGKVLAAWNGDSLLVRTDAGRVVDAELRNGGTLPRPGETIELAGLPETTLYNLRLNRAIWRPAESESAKGQGETPLVLKASEIVRAEAAQAMNIRLHGETLRLRGVIRSIPKTGLANGLIYLEDDGFIVPVNPQAAAGALRDLEIGCTVEATGVCVMDADVWRPNAVFPRIRGYILVTRGPADIRILSRPPWLTPARMLVIVGILFAVIVGILLWNRTLRIRSERRGRQLAREQILRAESELKVHERTRLAVELHDALSQNLAGIALELKTIAALENDPVRAKEHLRIADRSLLASREELRNCLHDLRSAALEETTMDEAIRKTLAPHVDKGRLTVRFNVARARISDNTAHAILCIVRELVQNALRHGQATDIRVAGLIDGGRLLFSVKDNGCGFDPAACPGVRQGHFGLQGIRERVRALKGEFEIASTPGAGTKATVTIALPKEGAANG